MKIIGERALPVSRQVVWTSLFDPAILQQCIPGCESIEKDGDASYKAVVVMSIGPLRVRFSGTLDITEAQEPVQCRLLFEGAGGPAGLAKGSADVTLFAAGDDTRLAYCADTQIAGKLAQVGARLIDSVARKLATEFFDKFESALVNDPA